MLLEVKQIVTNKKIKDVYMSARTENAKFYGMSFVGCLVSIESARQFECK